MQRVLNTFSIFSKASPLQPGLAEFFSGATFSTSSGGYSYSAEIGPDGQFKQNDYVVGYFSKFSGNVAKYEGGTFCSSIGPRSGSVLFVEDCSATSINVTVTEPSMCYYSMMVVSVCPSPVSDI